MLSRSEISKKRSQKEDLADILGGDASGAKGEREREDNAGKLEPLDEEAARGHGRPDGGPDPGQELQHGPHGARALAVRREGFRPVLEAPQGGHYLRQRARERPDVFADSRAAPLFGVGGHEEAGESFGTPSPAPTDTRAE